MNDRKNGTERVVVLAMMLALEIILTRFVSVNTPVMRIGFGSLPIVIAAILYGPLWAGVTYAAGDFIGAMLFPTGAFFPGFTLSAFLTGAIYGLFLYNKKRTLLRVVCACAVVMTGINLLLNTLWLSILLGKAWIALLPARIVKEAVTIPVYAAMIMAVDRLVIARIRKGTE